jgi:hypothetical protein
MAEVDDRSIALFFFTLAVKQRFQLEFGLGLTALINSFDGSIPTLGCLSEGVLRFDLLPLP